MKKKSHQQLAGYLHAVALSLIVSCIFTACTKSSTTVNTVPVLPAEAIRGTTLSGGNVKGVMLTDSVYTVTFV